MELRDAVCNHERRIIDSRHSPTRVKASSSKNAVYAAEFLVHMMNGHRDFHVQSMNALRPIKELVDGHPEIELTIREPNVIPTFHLVAKAHGTELGSIA